MKKLREVAYLFDEPVKYKELFIHPARMKDYYIFMYLSSCLFLERASHTDPLLAVKAISMGYLDYLFSMSNNENKLIDTAISLLRFMLRDADGKDVMIAYHRKKGGDKAELVINGHVYDSSDFEAIREIIAEQNSLELPDERIQKNVRDELEKARLYKQKLNNTTVAGLEEQMMALATYTGWTIEYISDMTIRKFFIALKRANHSIMSNIYLSASMSGFVTFKSKDVLRGWLADINDSDKYGDVKIDPEALQRKVSFEDAKKN